MLPTDLEYRTLQSCYDDIRRQLHYHSVGPKLLSKGVITFEAHEEIKSEKVSFMQNEAFLKFLMNGSRDGFYAFQNILVNTAGMTHLYDSLQGRIVVTYFNMKDPSAKVASLPGYPD